METKTKVAYRRGLFDERMNRILVDPSDDTKVNNFMLVAHFDSVSCTILRLAKFRNMYFIEARPALESVRVEQPCGN